MKTVVHVKTDKEIKLNAQALASKLGLSLSDVINASLRDFLRTRKVIFSDIPRMTPGLERLLGRVDKDIKAGKNLSPSFDSSEAMDDFLDSKK